MRVTGLPGLCGNHEVQSEAAKRGPRLVLHRDAVQLDPHGFV